MHNFVIRYCSYVALINPAESLDELLARMAEVEQEEFLNERKQLNLTIHEETKIHRFQFHREKYLAELEARRDAAVVKTNTPIV